MSVAAVTGGHGCRQAVRRNIYERDADVCQSINPG